MLGAGADDDSFPVTALEFTYREQDDLRHRDFLGSLMALGIRRDTLGDILTGKGRTVIFVRDDIVPFLLSDVDKIGRVGLVMVDHVTQTEVSSFLKEGMTITIRKYGKFVLTELRGTSKKGKLRVAVKHYR